MEVKFNEGTILALGSLLESGLVLMTIEEKELFATVAAHYYDITLDMSEKAQEELEAHLEKQYEDCKEHLINKFRLYKEHLMNTGGNE